MGRLYVAPGQVTAYCDYTACLSKYIFVGKELKEFYHETEIGFHFCLDLLYVCSRNKSLHVLKNRNKPTIQKSRDSIIYTTWDIPVGEFIFSFQ